MEYRRIPIAGGGYDYARFRGSAEAPFAEEFDTDLGQWIRNDRLWAEIRYTGEWSIVSEDDALAAVAKLTPASV